jgi:hypothetical protein
MLRSISLAVFLTAVPATAFATSCPTIMAEIDAALPTATLAEADMTKVKQLRAQGLRLLQNSTPAIRGPQRPALVPDPS